MRFNNFFMRYFLALLATGIAFSLRVILVHFVGNGLATYITFYPFVMIVALLGGLGPGLVTTISSILIVDYWFLPPIGVFRYENTADAVGAVFFLGMGILMSVVVEYYRRAQKKSIAALHLANLYNRSLLEASIDPLVTISANGKITDVNEATIKATGRTREELIGTEYASYFTEPEKAQAGYQQVFAKGFVKDYPLTMRHKNGKLMDVLYNASLYKDNHGNIAGIFAAARDVTLLNQAEAELRRHRDSLEILVNERTADLESSNRDLARTNENLEQFAYVASHDLQEPLRVMSSYSQLLEKRYKDKLDQDANDFIEFIVDAAKRMQTLITDLLSYSRIGRAELPMKDVDVDSIVNKIIKGMSSSIEQSGGIVSHDQLPVLLAHEISIIQLFQNLISNALKFRGEEAPRIHISVKRNDAGWTFSVADNGLGIEPQYHERIFQIFQRLHSRSEYSGTGIGLSICKKIVENYGGEIWVESQKGKGSIFYFTIPIKGEKNG
ncbi:MAG: DUF4118 domain-containing protein [Candidatus Omnitrophica bacterium]|nr:DUF4118 domain-containing protein [Candidatus Omnitrophota bacterium]